MSRKEQDEINEKNKLECETRIEKKLRDTVQSQFTKKKSHIREYPYKQIAVCFYKTKNFENAVQKIKSETERKIFCSLITKKVRKEILKDIEYRLKEKNCRKIFVICIFFLNQCCSQTAVYEHL